MDLYNGLKSRIIYIKYRLSVNNTENVFWIINFIPRYAGFSYDGDKIFVPLWAVHLALLIYVYGVGIIAYQLHYAEGFEDYLISNVNVSLFILIANCSYWCLTKRAMLKKTLKNVFLNDELTVVCKMMRNKYEKRLSMIKMTVLVFYLVNFVNAIFVYYPNRVQPSNNFSMTSCVGMEPLTESPQREICSVILCCQEMTISTIVLNYQALLLFLVGHTTVVFQILSDDTRQLHKNDRHFVEKKIPNLVARHSLILETIYLLKALYNAPIGINFISNAVCISLFFLLPLKECVKFVPIFAYCFLVFFLYCYLGQKLINASGEFQVALYSCGWENFDVKDQKSIYIMLTMSQKPVMLLAADIFPLNIYTFATNMQLMYKFVTLLKF